MHWVYRLIRYQNVKLIKNINVKLIKILIGSLSIHVISMKSGINFFGRFEWIHQNYIIYKPQFLGKNLGQKIYLVRLGVVKTQPNFDWESHQHFPRLDAHWRIRRNVCVPWGSDQSTLLQKCRFNSLMRQLHLNYMKNALIKVIIWIEHVNYD